MGLFRRSEAKRLKKAGDVEALLVLAANGSAKERFDALFALSELNLDDLQRREVVDVASAALAGEDDDVRGAGAFVLGTLRVDESAADLVDALRTGKDYTRLMAAAALGWLAPPEAYEPLVAAARGEGDDLVRDQATRALASYPEAADTLRELGTDAARDALRELGQDP